MGMDLDDLEEMYDGTADNRGALKRDYDAERAENKVLREALRAALRGLNGDDSLLAARCSGKISCGRCYALQRLKKLNVEDLLK